MRILFVSNFYPPYDLGGMEQLCHEIVNNLQERRHDCYVLTGRYGPHKRSPAETGITRALYLQADVHYYRPLNFFLQHFHQLHNNRHVLRRALDTLKPDIVFIWGMWNLSTQVAYWAEQWMPERVAYMVASYWMTEPDVHTTYWQLPANHVWAEMLKMPIRRLALNILARERKICPLSLRHVACVSDYVRRKLLGAGALPHDARVIYNGIRPEPFMQARQARPQRHRDEMQLIYELTPKN